jgi:hypothetical protein
MVRPAAVSGSEHVKECHWSSLGLLGFQRELSENLLQLVLGSPGATQSVGLELATGVDQNLGSNIASRSPLFCRTAIRSPPPRTRCHVESILRLQSAAI